MEAEYEALSQALPITDSLSVQKARIASRRAKVEGRRSPYVKVQGIASTSNMVQRYQLATDYNAKTDYGVEAGFEHKEVNGWVNGPAATRDLNTFYYELETTEQRSVRMLNKRMELWDEKTNKSHMAKFNIAITQNLEWEVPDLSNARLDLLKAMMVSTERVYEAWYSYKHMIAAEAKGVLPHGITVTESYIPNGKEILLLKRCNDDHSEMIVTDKSYETILSAEYKVLKYKKTVFWVTATLTALSWIFTIGKYVHKKYELEREIARIATIKARAKARRLKKAQRAAESKGHAGGGYDEEDDNCLICYSNARSVAFVPCGHLYICIDCAGKVTECPWCSTPIQNKLRVYQ
jgi:hypothetical protein